MAGSEGSFLNARPTGLMASGLVQSPATVRDAKSSIRRSKMTARELQSLQQLNDTVGYSNAALFPTITPITGHNRKQQLSVRDGTHSSRTRYSMLERTADYTVVSDLSDEMFEMDATRNLLEPTTPGGFTKHMAPTIQCIPGEDPGFAATSSLYLDFKHCLKKHDAASDVFELLGSYEEVCSDSEALLRKVMEAAASDPMLNSAGLLEMIRDEKRTWRLIACLYSDRLKTEALEGSMIVDELEMHADEKRTIDRLFKENDEVRQAQIVIDWLEQNSSDDLDDEVIDKVQHYSEAVSWENTLHYLNQQKLHGDVGSEKRHIVTQMDPDAPSRQRKPLADLDRSDEIRLLKSMFSFIRAGKIEKAQNLCMFCGQPWRVVSLEGWKLYSDSNYENLNEGGPAEIEGNPLRDLWKLASWSISQDEAVHVFERAIYGSLCGNLKAMVNVCTSWEDFVWAHFKAMTDTMVEHELRHSPTLLSRIRPECPGGAIALPEAYWEQRVNLSSPGLIFEQIQAISSESVRQEADSPFHTIQRYIITEDIASLIDKSHAWIRDSEACAMEEGDLEVHPQLLRFLAHLILFLRTIGVSMDENKCEIILEAYVRYLAEKERSAGLVAYYTAALSPTKQIEVYSDFLKTIDDKNLRQEYLEKASEAGLDVPTITKTVVEGIRQQGDIDMTLQTERSGIGENLSEDSFDPTLEPLTSHEDWRKIEALEWLVFDSSQRAEAIKQCNALMRSFLVKKKYSAAKEVFQKVPSGSVDVVYRDWTEKMPGSSALPPEDANAIREYLCMQAYLSAKQSFTEWFKFFHHNKPTAPAVPQPSARSEQKFLNIVAQDHRDSHLEDELQKWSDTCKKMCATVRDKIYNVLLFPGGGWLVDAQLMTETEETRLRNDQLKLLRRTCIPTLCHFLITALKSTEAMKEECMHLPDVLASEEYQLYKILTKDEGRKIMSRIQDVAIDFL